MRAAVLSAIYRGVRVAVLQVVYLWQRITRQPKNLEPAIVCGDVALSGLNRIVGPVLFSFPSKTGNPVNLFDLHFDNPITFAAFKDDVAILDIWLRMGLAGGCFKTILKDPRPGNAQPRIQDVPPNIINAMGLPGKGIDGFIEHLSGHRIFRYERPLGASVGGNSVAEYESNVMALEASLPEISYYELNISCPNTPEGQDMIQHLNLLEDLCKTLRQKTQKVIGIKVSPDQRDDSLHQIAEIAKGIDRVYINAGNTSYRQSDLISIGGGGLSGPSLFPRTLDMTRLFAGHNLPVIATGGISSRAHVLAVREAGATLVGVATALVKDMFGVVGLSRL